MFHDVFRDLESRARPASPSHAGYDIAPLPQAEVERLAQDLTPEERRILLNHGTEPSFCGVLLDNKAVGTYACHLCGLPLFRSGDKFDSGTGWPSFFKPYDIDHIRYIKDASYGMSRTEIRCMRCDGHLGHVFPDGPPPTYHRYCMNSASMEFFTEGTAPVQKAKAAA